MAGAVARRLRSACANARGYSMAEVLATVAIIAVLGCIVAVNVVSFQANLRQSELDAKAEVIYAAAQEQMTRIMASGRDSLFAPPDAAQAASASTDPAAPALASATSTTTASAAATASATSTTTASTDPAAPALASATSTTTASAASATSAYGVQVTPELPLDVPRSESGEPAVEQGRICYISSAHLASANLSAAQALFGSGGLDDGLLNSHWVIEYDYKTLTVYSVFYSESFDCADSGASNGYSALFSTAYNSTLRSWAGRLDAPSALGSGCYVGYHGGGSSSGSAGGSVPLSPELQVVNAEKLVATVKCSKPAINEDLGFLVTLADDYGHTRTMFFAPSTFDTNKVSIGSAELHKATGIPLDGQPLAMGVTGVSYQKDGSLYTLTMVLDSLESDDTRFNAIYGSGSGAGSGGAQTLAQDTGLVAGSTIHMSVEVLCDNALVEARSADPRSFNSLFADDAGTHVIKADGTAGIACGRHLQNLDAGSGVGAQVTAALQYTNIDFSSTAAGNSAYPAWLSTYGGGYYHGLSGGLPCFEPIENPNLLSYRGDGSASGPDGTAHSIIRLSASEQDASAPAGLFGSVNAPQGKEMRIENLALTGTSLSGQGAVGGLVGEHRGGTLVISGCQLYLSTSTDTPGKSYTDLWLQGATTGGLVGESTGGTLSIESSSASTVASGSSAAGGLVGSTGSASVSISSSYADCYLSAPSTGGLVGSGSVASLSSCYSAGYLGGLADGFSAAGLVNGHVGSMTSCYTVCARLGERSAASWYTTARSSSSHSRVLYHYVSGEDAPVNLEGTTKFDDSMGDSALLAALAGSGSAATPFTINQKTPSRPYNLKGQSLVSYTWPSIAELYHYGDWDGGFQPGTLVYFEEYLVGGTPEFGFEGANVTSTLKDLGSSDSGKIVVVGDGYGVVYASGGIGEASLTVTVSNPQGGELGSQVIDKSSPSIKTANNYVIYPLGCGGTMDAAGVPNISNTAQVNGSSYYLKATLGADNYYFNPHFARTVHAAGQGEDPTPPGEQDYIYIRTARQLYNLSLHYGAFRSVTQGHTFYQERNIAYTEYRWKVYTQQSSWNQANIQKGRVCQQAPIGASKGGSFAAVYDGACHEITDVSFVAENELYAGMFGYVGADAAVRNVVLCTDYAPASSGEAGAAGSSSGSGSAQAGEGEGSTEAELDLQSNYFVQHKGGAQANSTVHMGVLAGYNAGSIENCATAGYFLAGGDGTVHAYANSSTHLGGLVGTNAGTVRQCASDAPKLRLSLYQATTSAGGFAGSNEGGSIEDCYALGAIEVVYAEGGTADIAGFAGANSGRITGSYCATAITLSGEATQSYGFAPAGGFTSGCSYLNGGTYSYVNRMYAYSFETATFHTSGTPISYSEMAVLPGQEGAVSAANTFIHSQTNTASMRYPYRGVVEDAAGQLVHYGNWQDDVKLGTMGVFYWEHEEGGGNEGYHMTYLGNYEDTTVGGTSQVAGQSSLCNSHNDGGLITEYGYGFYVQRGQEEKLEVKWDRIACSGGGEDGYKSAESIIAESRFNEEASADFSRQMKSIGIGTDEGGNSLKTVTEFYFCAFSTHSFTTGSDYLCLSETVAADGAASVQNGTLSMQFTPVAGQDTVTYSFTVSPFFANAMSIDGITEGTQSKAVGSAEVKAADDRVTDYSSAAGATHAVGMADNPYEVRSLQQLQCINWNAAEKSTDVLVAGASNYKHYPYLMYADKLKSDGSKTMSTLESVVTNADTRARGDLTWLQSHDIAEVHEDHYVTPIAGTATSSKYNSYENVLYAWFGSNYNGQSYAINNVAIKSSSFSVGLFGTTVGASLKNIIMSVESGLSWVPTVERATPDSSTEGSYAIGGLVGVAYDYQLEDTSNTIENCAVSGYVIKDSSSDKLGLGEANIGGLIGVANVNLERCEAVTQIVLDQRYGAGSSAYYGIYTRVGGITGATQGVLKDCYSGGSCQITAESWVTGTNAYSRVKGGNSNYKQQKVFIGGIAGSGFTSNYVNFSNISDVIDGSPKVHNCYTYFEFPEDNGFTTSQNSSTEPKRELVRYAIAGLADRATEGSAKGFLTLDNCYYPQALDGMGVSAYYPYPSTSYTNKVTADTVSSKTHAEMSDDAFVTLLNAGRSATGSTPAPWQHVDTVDYAGEDISGKFSFPSDQALVGKDYPYPAVIQQNDLTFGTYSDPKNVHVHYGDWPKQGSYWELGRASMDIFTDMGEHLADWGRAPDGYAYQQLRLVVDTLTDTDAPSPLEAGSYSYCDSGSEFGASSGIAQVVQARAVPEESTERLKVYDVLVRALNAGSTKIRLGSIESATCTLEVTANWLIEAAGEANTAYDQESSTLWLEANNSLKASIALSSRAEQALEGQEPKDYTANTSWAFSSDKDSSLSYGPNSYIASKLQVTRTGSGTVVLTVGASYNYQGVVFQKKLFITVEEPVQVGLSNAVTNDGSALEGSQRCYNELALGGASKSNQNMDAYSGTPAPSYESTERNLFLYTPSSSSFLTSSQAVAGVAFEDMGQSPVDSSAFKLVFDSEPSIQSGRMYLAGTAYYLGTPPSGSLKVTVTLLGGYQLVTVVPQDKVLPYVAHTLTLQAGARVKNYSIPEGGEFAAVPGYESGVFNTTTPDYELDGWYYLGGASPVQVLSKEGSVVAEVSGITSGGKLALGSDVTLYARWKHQQTVWIQETGSIKPDVNYIIVNKNGSGTGTASIAAQPNQVPADNTEVDLVKRTATFKQELVEISGTYCGNYIENSGDVLTAGSVWVASTFNNSYHSLTNQSYGGLFAENNNKSAYSNRTLWGVTALKDQYALEGNNKKRASLSLKGDGLTDSLWNAQGGYVRFYESESTYILACETTNVNVNDLTGSPVYLFKSVTADYTFEAPADLQASGTSLSTLSLHSAAQPGQELGAEPFVSANPARSPEQRVRRRRR